jgi:hypothetical protein
MAKSCSGGVGYGGFVDHEGGREAQPWPPFPARSVMARTRLSNQGSFAISKTPTRKISQGDHEDGSFKGQRGREGPWLKS